HIGIFVKDIEKSMDYYKRLGFTVDKEEQLHIRLAFISAGNCLIELVEQKDLPPRPAGVVDHVAMVVDDIDAAIANAKANGINIDESTVGTVPILGGVKNVFFDGPDGERLEFFEYCSKN
ncbi:MAG: VOC family protein, partial [Firmicutes bacterium]|nr:VOC family protein [Bacillota bacterium]